MVVSHPSTSKGAATLTTQQSLASSEGVCQSMVERQSKSEKGCGFDPHSSNYDFWFDKG
nr:MAG TPA: hypothetical protein [Caudoviricetes sp.]